MWIRLNDEVELPEKGHHMTIDLEDNGKVLQGAKIIGKLIEDEEGKTNRVSVRWHDGYLEEFEATEVRFGSDLLWLRLSDGKNRHIPLRSVRWFGMSQESHQSSGYRNKPVYPELTAEWIPHLPNEEDKGYILAPQEEYDGLKRKYVVLKSDSGEPVEDCFVLRPDKDKAAIAALLAYADATDNQVLAKDIRAWISAIQAEEATQKDGGQDDV